MKNTLKVIVALLVFIFGIIIIDTLFVTDEKTNENVKEEIVEFQLTFLISPSLGEFELVEFNDDEKKVILEEISKLDYSRNDIDLAILGEYKLIFDNKELIFNDDDTPYGELRVDGEIYTIVNIKNLKQTILDYVKKKEINRVYLYERKDLPYVEYERINLTEENKKLIKNEISMIKLLEPEEMIDLVIQGKYMLIIDDSEIYFDDLSGYVLFNNEMALISEELKNILETYIDDEKFSNDECCSCCPDLKPGEVCISACCSCTEGGIINAE